MWRFKVEFHYVQLESKEDQTNKVKELLDDRLWRIFVLIDLERSAYGLI